MKTCSRSSFAMVCGIALTMLSIACGRGESVTGDIKPGVNGPPQENRLAMWKQLSRSDFGDSYPPANIVDQYFYCRDKSVCDSVKIRIVPEVQAHLKNWPDSGLKNGSGHIVAKFQNVGNKPYDVWHLGVKEIAYLWIGPTGKVKRLPTLYRLDALPFKHPVALYEFPSFRYCPGTYHYNPPAAVHMEASLACEEEHIAGEVPPIAPPQGMWVSCSNGCCRIGVQNRDLSPIALNEKQR